MISFHPPLARLARLVGILMIAAVAVGCGGGDDDSPQVASLGSVDTAPDDTTQSSAPADPEEAMLAFTECMRDHGIDMPDPQPSGGRGGGGMIALEDDPSSEEFEEAQAACEPLMEDAFGELEIDPEREAEMREELLEFSACMRDHGIDMPDPVFGENGRVEIEGGDEGMAPGEAIVDDDFQAAAEECGRPGGFLVTTDTTAGS